MKKAKRLLTPVTFLLIISLSLLPVHPALAQSYITLENFSGSPNGIIVNGGGWAPGETVSLYVNSVSGQPAANATAGNDSFFGPVTLNIPFNTPQGALPIIAVGSITNEQQSNSYYVVPFSGSITVIGNNTPGSTLSLAGQGFAPNEIVRFTLNGNDIGQTTANASGNFLGATATVPNIAIGTYQLHALGQASNTDAIDYFYVGGFFPSVTPSTYYLLPTQVLNFSGGGFAVGETIQIFEGQNQTPLASITADEKGNFADAGNITIPLNFTGPKIFRLIGLTSQSSAQVEITVGQFNPNVFPSTHYILPGEVLTFSGGGFAVNEPVKIFSGESQTELANFIADAKGDFVDSGAITIPFDWTGSSRTFRLVGQTGGGTGDITITVGQFNSLVSPSLYHIMAGEKISFSGNGFAPNEKINITAGQDAVILATITASPIGSFMDSGTVTIPFNWSNSSRTFHLVGQSSQTKADAIITVAEFLPQVTPSSYYLLPGSQISFSGSGFGTLEDVIVTESQNSSPLATISTDVAGGFQDLGSFIIPFNWAGKNTLVFRGQSTEALTKLDISLAAFSPQLSPSTYYAQPGEQVTVAGSGFAPNEIIHISLNNGTAIIVTASSTGEFSGAGPFTAPVFGSTLHFAATGQSSNIPTSVDISLANLYPSVTPDQWYVPSGSTILFSGDGFAPGEEIILTSGGGNLATFSANTLGSFANQAVITGFGNDRSVTYTFTGQESKAVVATALTIAGLQPYISLDNYYAAPGAIIQVSGSGFAPGEPVTVHLGSATAQGAANSQGNVISVSIAIPFDMNGGTVTMTGNTSKASGSTALSVAPFAPQVTPSTWYTPAGSIITFTGQGFAAGETVNISLNNSAIGSAAVDANGAFASSPIIIPFGSNSGSFVFIGTASKTNIMIPITLAQLNSGLQLSTYYDVGGVPIQITGMGFASNEDVDITFGGQTLGTATADLNGNFTFNSTVPYLPSGDKNVQAKGVNSGSAATTNFTQAQVYVNAQLGSYAGPAGASVTFVGSGFMPGETISITTDRTGAAVVHSFTADSSGNFNNSGYQVPVDFIGGPLTLTIKGEHSLAPVSINYYVTG